MANSGKSSLGPRRREGPCRKVVENRYRFDLWDRWCSGVVLVSVIGKAAEEGISNFGEEKSTRGTDED